MALFARATANKLLLTINFCANLSSNQCTIKKSASAVVQSRLFKQCCVSNTNNSNSMNPTSKKSARKQGNENRSDAVPLPVENFDKFLATRRRESRRTVIVQVQSPDSYQDLYSYCTEFGPVKSMHHYVVAKSTHFFLVEFKDLETHKAVLDSATFINPQEVIPTYSYMLWFRNAPKKLKKIMTNIPPVTINTANQPREDELYNQLRSTKSISEQMERLHNMWKLDEVSTRLRFMTALQVEQNLSALFSNITILPFGSSVNSFGKRGCDLDLVMILDSERKEKSNSRLVFQTKSVLPDERTQTKKSMEVIATVIQAFIPGIKNVRKILHARVPIIKYDHALTGLECDLSMTNMSAVYMSELLYIFGEHDERVRPLVFTIRQWAKSVGLTNANPGNWITNFSLTLLVIFMLQQKRILPSINTLKNLARSSDVRLTETCIDCTFLRNPKMIPQSSESPIASLEALLSDFFNYYSNFDFSTQAICLREGTSRYKADSSPLYICNPLEKTLNVSKNVSSGELMRFINAVRNAALLMDDLDAPNSQGIVDVFLEKQPQQRQFIMGRLSSSKKVRIAELFRGDNVDKLENSDSARTDNFKKERARRR